MAPEPNLQIHALLERSRRFEAISKRASLQSCPGKLACEVASAPPQQANTRRGSPLNAMAQQPFNAAIFRRGSKRELFDDKPEDEAWDAAAELGEKLGDLAALWAAPRTA